MPALTRSLLTWGDKQQILEQLSDHAICMLDLNGRIASWSHAAHEIHGYRADEVVGESFSRLYPEEDLRAGTPEQDLDLARTAGRVESEGWRLRKDGSRFWANVVLTALHDEGGKLLGFATVTRDATERHRTELALRQAEERFHDLVDAVTDYAIFILDGSGHVATWNSGAKRIKGYEPEAIIGQHFSCFYDEADRLAGKPERVLEMVRRDGRVEDEGWRVRKDGSRFWANVVVTALRSDSGELLGFAKITRDLSERRRAEEELRQSEERFRLMVEGVSGHAIYLLSPEGRVTTWNLGARRVYGYETEQVLGQDFSIFIAPDEGSPESAAGRLAFAREHGRFEEEGFRVRKGGATFWAHSGLTALRSDGDELVGFCEVTQDLTARRQAEQTARELLREQVARAAAEQNESLLRASEEAARRAASAAQEAAERADEANRIKDEFLATVSHELRTPLNAILGWASLLRGRGDDPSLRRGIEAIHRNAQAQARIVEDILDVSRIITGKLRLDLRAVDILTSIHDALDVVRPSAEAKEVTLEFKPPSEIPGFVGDPGRLQQVIWNLLSNAVKFTERNGRVTLSVEQQGATLVISVHDTGRGIEPEFLPHVFDRFKQADSSSTRRYGGLGLGLAIVRHIVELHGGRVHAESAGLGHGALFRVTLPIRAVVPAPGDERPKSVAPSEPPLPAAPHGIRLDGLRVLVVDDDGDARDLLESVLVAAGAAVETAPSAAVGIELVRRSRPHVLVSDIGMPGEDGYSFVRRVRAFSAESGISIPSIALTAYTRGIDRTKALAAGFTTHISKPVNPDDLVAAVANLAIFVTR